MSTASSPTTFITSHYGCEQGRLGCSPGTTQPDNLRIVVSSGVSPAHQQSSNASSLSSCISFPITFSGLCDGVIRQHISRGLHRGTGEHTHTPCIWKPRIYSFFARASTSTFWPNTYQVISMSWQTVCLANIIYFRQSGHIMRKWLTRFFSRSVIL
ncbi:hypothetical protein DPMN_079655 [Dreissena polymorpha]|uniref:Uncharacterized protein n=1 Tax=Dreissena polymorpha TaxID=45954 RepID=A0A9D4BRD5_DREPO|nr:hypothetical protein DPMN_079655 [Dreissena polymorpha]